jgi:cytochrome oxidase Cu insertion factor (SCO1/SenC/PrrC family)
MLGTFRCAKIAFAVVVGLALLIPAGAAHGSAAQEDKPMDSTELINGILKKMGSGEKIDPAEFKRFVDLQNADLKTGPAVGSKVPDFALEDQSGRRLTLHDLMGPEGMLLVFTRSADW